MNDTIELPDTIFKVHFTGEGREREETFCALTCQCIIDNAIDATNDTLKQIQIIQEALREHGYDLTPGEVYAVVDATDIQFKDFKKKLPTSLRSATTTESTPRNSTPELSMH